MISVKIEGVAENLARLQNLDKKLRTRALRQAMNQAGKLVLGSAKAKVSVKSGLLRKSLGRKVKTYRNNGVTLVIVGPRSSFKAATKYAHLVEGGTKFAVAKPFIEPAGRESTGTVQRAIENIVNNALEDAGN